MSFLEDYEVNDKTLALCSLENKTRVYEENGSFIVDKSANEIMENSCSYFGSSLEGRQKGTQKLIGVSYKAPVIVEETKDIIFFPTSSPRSKSCSWLRSSKINNYYYRGGKLIVEFTNGDKVIVDASYGVIDNQIIRAMKLEMALRSRKLQQKRVN